MASLPQGRSPAPPPTAADLTAGWPAWTDRYRVGLTKAAAADLAREAAAFDPYLTAAEAEAAYRAAVETLDGDAADRGPLW
jgi:hypothetical protein